MLAPNPNLVAIVRKYLLPEFKRHGKHPSRSRYLDDSGLPCPAYFDPWWWPINPANHLELWGLLPGEKEQLDSLCELPKRGNSYPGFRGSLGAAPGCVFLLGERPSFNTRYGAAVTGVYDLLGQMASTLKKQLTDFHVTDLIRFRGEPGHSTEDLCSHMIDVSVECLSQEFSVLKPTAVVITDMAEALLPFVQSKLNVLDKRLDAVLKHPNRVPVRHWSRQ
jgi:hypothetical protein